MKIQNITVTNLFGYLNHEINFDKSNKISILLGDNGIGKTTILNMIHNVFALRFGKFLSIDFDTFSVKLGARTYLRIIKEGEEEKNLKIMVRAGSVAFSCAYSEILEKMQNIVENSHSFLRRDFTRLNTKTWIHDKTRMPLTIEDVFFYLVSHLPHEIININTIIPNEIRQVATKISVSFISTTRLQPTFLIEDNVTTIGEDKDAINQCSKLLLHNLNLVLSKSSQLIAEYDSTYAKRLIDKLTINKREKERFDYDMLAQVENKQNRLYKLGLLPRKISAIDIKSISLRPAANSALNLYYSDIWNKLKVYDRILDEAENFIEILNEFYLGKVVGIDYQEGVFVKNIKTGRKIPLSRLSSGEKHLFYLIFKLIFSDEKDMIVLIDEPEISLHITWQRLFIKALERIAELKEQEYLLATHSPSIIGKNRNLTIEI